jgi:hypothetical protein
MHNPFQIRLPLISLFGLPATEIIEGRFGAPSMKDSGRGSEFHGRHEDKDGDEVRKSTAEIAHYAREKPQNSAFSPERETIYEPLTDFRRFGDQALLFHR